MASDSATAVPTFDNKTKAIFAEYFVPTLHITPGERYRFMSAGLYASSMCNVVNKDQITDPNIDPYLQWKQEFDSYNPPFKPNKKYKTKVLPPESLLDENQISFYGYFDQEKDPETNKIIPGLIRITYSIFYPFNGFATVLVEYDHHHKKQKEKESFLFELGPQGRHQGDWERVTIFIKLIDNNTPITEQLDPNKWELYCVYASQHDAYHVGLPKKYYDLYQSNEEFKTNFNNSKGYTKSFRVQKIHLRQLLQSGKEFHDVFEIEKEKITEDLDKHTDHNKQSDENDAVTTGQQSTQQSGTDTKDDDGDSKKDKGELQPVSLVETVDNNGINAIAYSAFNGHPNHFSLGLHSTLEVDDLDLSKTDFDLTFGTIKSLKFVDWCGELKDDENNPIRFYQFGDSDKHSTDEQKEKEINEDKYPPVLNKVTLLVSQTDEDSKEVDSTGTGSDGSSGVKWFVVDSNNNYELVSCEWGNIGTTHRWGEIQDNSFKNSNVPASMKKESKKNKESAEHTAYHLILTLKTIAQLSSKLMDALSTKQAGPWAGTHDHGKKGGIWWIGKELHPYVPN